MGMTAVFEGVSAAPIAWHRGGADVPACAWGGAEQVGITAVRQGRADGVGQEEGVMKDTEGMEDTRTWRARRTWRTRKT